MDTPRSFHLHTVSDATGETLAAIDGVELLFQKPVFREFAIKLDAPAGAIFAVVFLIVNLLVDILYAVLNPRIRYA